MWIETLWNKDILWNKDTTVGPIFFFKAIDTLK
jgi:hypothetical protein